jgi:flagellar basal-body rod modification protein FlgD
MTSIAAAGAASAASNANPADSKARIANNFDQFLQLLTTQLKNQNPLDPLDTNQFTQQLVQFAGVEQQIKTNDNLSALLIANKTQTMTNALGFVGSNVTFRGPGNVLQDGKAAWKMAVPRAGNATIVIKDANGAEVYKETVTLTGGEQAFNWDGRKTAGGKAPDGVYTAVISAKDSAGQVMTINTTGTGKVDSVDVSGDNPLLRIGVLGLKMTDVMGIRR